MEIKNNTIYFTREEMAALAQVSGICSDILWRTPCGIKFYNDENSVVFTDEQLANASIIIDRLLLNNLTIKEEGDF